MSTDFISHLNWLAIAAGALGYFILGAIWYSFIFKNAWIRMTGVKMDDPAAKKGAGGIMVLTLLLEFVTTFGIAVLVYRMGLTGYMSGIKLGLLTGVCFCAIAVFISYLYQMKPTGLSFIDGGYHIVGNIIAAIVVCVWH
jgi:hypothetical protein